MNGSSGPAQPGRRPGPLPRTRRPRAAARVAEPAAETAPESAPEPEPAAALDPAPEPAGRREPSRPRRTVPTLGRVPEVAVIAAFGLVLIALGNNLARSSSILAGPLFWLGLITILAPIAVRLVGRSATRRERLWLVAILGLSLYLVKFLHDPLQFTMYDEILHIRTADDILVTGGLFAPNSLLTASPLYPGLEILTSVLCNLTGASVYEAGLVVIGASRLIVVVGLFLLYERLSDSARAAGIGVLVYAANPQFLYFNAQFSYESLGIALTVLVLGLASTYGGRSRRGLVATAVVGLAVVVSHHLTAYVLTVTLGVWALVAALPGMPRGERRTAGLLTVAMVGFIVFWLAIVAWETVPYLAPRFGDAFQLILLLLGQSQARELFAGPPGGVAAPWEQFLAYGSVLLVLAVLPLGLWRIWRDFRRNPLVITLGLVAATYPMTLALRLSQKGAEESTRTPEFVFLGVGLVAGLVLTADWRPAAQRFVPPVARLLGPVHDRLPHVAAVTAILILFGGGIVIGIPGWARQPGPYLPSADPRSIEPVSLAAAEWARLHLGEGNRFAADRINRVLMGSYGRQEAITVYRDGVPTWRLFTTPDVKGKEREILLQGQVGYLVVDVRLAGIKPLTRTYFESGEPPELAREGQLTEVGLTKWADEPGVNVVFDGGPVRIYDVRALLEAGE